jgi:hypothetical protein
MQVARLFNLLALPNNGPRSERKRPILSSADAEEGWA